MSVETFLWLITAAICYLGFYTAILWLYEHRGPNGETWEEWEEWQEEPGR